MAITPRNLVKHEMIGLMAEVVGSSDPSKIGIKGKIVDESENMVTIKTPGGDRKVPKHGSTFRISVGGAKVDVDGDVIMKKPHDRIKEIKTRG